LLDHTFDEPGQAVVALKQPSHHVLVYGNLELGHRISSSGCVGGYLNPFGGTVACPVCPQATSLLHSVSDATSPHWDIKILIFSSLYPFIRKYQSRFTTIFLGLRAVINTTGSSPMFSSICGTNGGTYIKSPGPRSTYS